MISQPCPDWVIWLTLLLPFSVTYLVHLPDTRTLRIGIWMISTTCLIRMLATVQKGPALSLRLAVAGILIAGGACTRWAFSHEAPAYHPSPRPQLYPFLRESTLFKAVYLVYSEHRHIGIAPYQPPLKADNRPWARLRAVAWHLGNCIFAFFICDLVSLPLAFYPDTFGSERKVGGNFGDLCKKLAAQWGVPALCARAFFTACFGSLTHFGMTCSYHMFATVGIASGIDLPEEWPAITHQPPLATSMNDLWGHRWHQAIRDHLQLIAKPFEGLPRGAYMLAVFTVSGLHHIALYYPRQQSLVVYPYLLFYSGCGVICILERAYRQVTGRRVGGIAGWLWTFTTIVLVSGPMIDHEYSSGWAGVMRHQFVPEPDKSMALQLLHGLGLVTLPPQSPPVALAPN